MKNKRNSAQRITSDAVMHLCRSAADKATRIVLSAVLACSVAGMAGCRDSAARTQKIVGDPGMYEVDNTLPPYAKPSDVGQQSTATEVVDEDEYSNDYDYDIPDYANNVNWNGVTAQQVTGDSPYDGEASSGVGDDADDAKAGASTAQANDGAGGAPGSSLAATGTGAQEGTQNPDDPDNPEQPDDPENPETPKNPEISQNPDSPIGGEKDPAPEWDRNESPKTEVPESRGGIAAFGPLAAVVQSLGGPGALRATNAAWLSDAKSRGAFPGELEGVTGVASWSATSLSDDAVNAVVASGADILLVSRYCGGLPNSAQAQYLAKNSVNVVSMPTYGTEDTQDSDIQTAVLMVDTMLRANFEGAHDRYKAWKSQHDGALSDCRRVNGGYTTPQQDAGLAPSNFLALGLAPQEMGNYSSSALGYMLGSSQVSSNRQWYVAAYSYDASLRISLGYLNRTEYSCHPVTSYYLQHAGWANALGDVEGYTKNIGKRMVTPASVILSHTSSLAPVYTYLGSSNFPGVFCYDEAVAQGLQQTYRLGVGNVTGSLTNNTFYDRSYRSRYNLYLVPSGVSGNWFDASFETFLLAPYAMRLWTNSVDADSYMQAFYQTFYRCNFNNGALSNYGTVLRSDG